MALTPGKPAAQGPTIDFRFCIELRRWRLLLLNCGSEVRARVISFPNADNLFTQFACTEAQIYHQNAHKSINVRWQSDIGQLM
jgi:hypothetical protein